MIFDSHAHLDVEEFDGDRAEVLKKIRDAGVKYVLNPGVDIETSKAAVRLASEHDWIYAAVGYYPQETRHMNYDLLEEIIILTEQPKVMAIGEIGLDYHWDDTPHDVQQFWFREQIRLAEKLGMPIIIHDREAHGDVFKILQEEKAFDSIKILFHCFSGSAEFARQLTDRGCFLSVAGPITYNMNRKAKAVLSAVPEDRLLVETDSPYLTPVPHRGERNDSSYIVHTIEKAAEYMGKTFEETAELTYRNALSFFGIKDGGSVSAAHIGE